MTPVIAYGVNARPLARYPADVVRDLMVAAGVESLLVSSTARTPEDQARAMFTNLINAAVADQQRLYGPSGDEVIVAFAEFVRSPAIADQIKAAMVKKILWLGPEKVSKHCADHRVLAVLDVSPRSIPDEQKRSAFIAAAKADRRVSKVLDPSSNDPAYHLEIVIPQTG